jgi:hypothetical protein
MTVMAEGLLQYETLDAEQINDIMARKPLQSAKVLNKNEDAQLMPATVSSEVAASTR